MINPKDPTTNSNSPKDQNVWPKNFPTLRYECKRCGATAEEASDNSCTLSPCPMIMVGRHESYEIPPEAQEAIRNDFPYDPIANEASEEISKVVFWIWVVILSTIIVASVISKLT